ncbi:unnamed protein product, partial [Meganyctiphanes norvegica]
IYLDDFVLHTATLEQHKLLLEEIFKRLAAAKLQLAIEKCSFFVDSVAFLGFLLSAKGVQADPSKIRPLMLKRAPETLTDVRSTLGMFNIYKKFIRHYSHIVQPIVALTKGHEMKASRGTKINWTPECELALEELKAQAAKYVVLKYPDFSAPFYVFCDASCRAVGGHVSQMVGEDMRPISFYSRILTPAEQNFSTIDREALAIYHVLDKAKSWLLGFRVIIWSDHMPLRFIIRNTSSNSRLNRWRMLLQEYSPTIHYVKGESNVVADWCSRFAFADPPVSRSVAMQESYAFAAHDSALPQAVPETFDMEFLEQPFSELDLTALTGPVVVFGDCMSVRPKGPLQHMAARLNGVATVFAKRRAGQAERPELPFCREEDAAALGTFHRTNSGDT